MQVTWAVKMCLSPAGTRQRRRRVAQHPQSARAADALGTGQAAPPIAVSSMQLADGMEGPQPQPAGQDGSAAGPSVLASLHAVPAGYATRESYYQAIYQKRTAIQKQFLELAEQFRAANMLFVFMSPTTSGRISVEGFGPLLNCVEGYQDAIRAIEKLFKELEAQRRADPGNPGHLRSTTTGNYSATGGPLALFKASAEGKEAVRRLRNGQGKLSIEEYNKLATQAWAELGEEGQAPYREAAKQHKSNAPQPKATAQPATGGTRGARATGASAGTSLQQEATSAGGVAACAAPGVASSLGAAPSAAPATAVLISVVSPAAASATHQLNQPPTTAGQDSAPHAAASHGHGNSGLHLAAAPATLCPPTSQAALACAPGPINDAHVQDTMHTMASHAAAVADQPSMFGMPASVSPQAAADVQASHDTNMIGPLPSCVVQQQGEGQLPPGPPNTAGSGPASLAAAEAHIGSAVAGGSCVTGCRRELVPGSLISNPVLPLAAVPLNSCGVAFTSQSVLAAATASANPTPTPPAASAHVSSSSLPIGQRASSGAPELVRQPRAPTHQGRSIGQSLPGSKRPAASTTTGGLHPANLGSMAAAASSVPSTPPVVGCTSLCNPTGEVCARNVVATGLAMTMSHVNMNEVFRGTVRATVFGECSKQLSKKGTLPVAMLQTHLETTASQLSKPGSIGGALRCLLAQPSGLFPRAVTWDQAGPSNPSSLSREIVIYISADDIKRSVHDAGGTCRCLMRQSIWALCMFFECRTQMHTASSCVFVALRGQHAGS
jgi:hypothetical protein